MTKTAPDEKRDPPEDRLITKPLFLISLTASLVLTISALLFVTQHRSLVSQLYQLYGDALAKIAAHQARDATLNHDLVSLQLTVRDATNNPAVSGAAIYDVTNQLLVQAGDIKNRSASQRSSIRRYRAAIVWQESTAGYVEVLLDTQGSWQITPERWLLWPLGGFGVLLIFSIVSHRFQRSRRKAAALSEAPTDNAEITVSDHCITVVLTLFNQTATQQSSDSNWQGQLQSLEMHLQEINAIYAGRVLRTNDTHIHLRIESNNGETDDSLIERALCSARLLQLLLSSTSSDHHLQVSAGLLYHARPKRLEEFRQHENQTADIADWLLKKADEIIMFAPGTLDRQMISSKCKFALSQDSEDWLAINELSFNLEKLLASQVRQIIDIEQ